MKNRNAPEKHNTRRLASACSTALAVAFTASLSQPALAGEVTAPAVPASIQVPAGNFPFLVGHGVGTQDYVCVPSGHHFAWTLFTPVATLFSNFDKQVTTHFFSPNPSESNIDPTVVADGTIRATWQHSRDSSTVWAKAFPPSFDPNFVRPGAVPWLLLEVVGRQDGPTGGDTLAPTTFIQRVNTVGGVAPSSGCSRPTDAGRKAFVPYTADYFFFSPAADDAY